MTWHEMVNILSACKTDGDRDNFNKLICGAFCEYPGCEKFGEIRRQNTQYEHPLSNWRRYCEEHQAEADDFWKEQWDEYYRGIL